MNFVFRIQTKIGGNVVIQDRDQYEAENKLRKRYPECTILNYSVR